MFSSTKGVSALAVAVAASQGLISYDARVADYWPEFAQASKGAITVRQMLSHQAGLPVIDPAPTLEDVSDPTRPSSRRCSPLRRPPGPLVVDMAITPSRWAGTNPN